jgi:hypothetical protein
MNEYLFYDVVTGEKDIVCGYTFNDALRRARLDNKDHRFKCLRVDYCD